MMRPLALLLAPLALVAADKEIGRRFYIRIVDPWEAVFGGVQLAGHAVLPNLVRLAGFSGHGAMFGPFTAHVARALCEAGHDVDTVETLGRPCPLAPFRVGRDFVHGEHMVI